MSLCKKSPERKKRSGHQNGVSGIAEKSTISLSTHDDVFLPKASVKREEILESLPKPEKGEFLTRQHLNDRVKSVKPIFVLVCILVCIYLNWARRFLIS